MGLFLGWPVRRRKPRRVDLEDLLKPLRDPRRRVLPGLPSR